jgi:mono/diheme cytochrome c family protein
VKALPCFLVTGLLAIAACDVQDPDFSKPVPPPGMVIDEPDSAPSNPMLPPPGLSPDAGFLGGLTGGIFGGNLPPGLIGGLGGGQAGPSGRPLRLEQLRTAATPPPPISGGTLAVSPDGSRVVAADSDRDAVFVIDIASLKVQKLSLPKGSEPGRVALDGQGGAHVILRGSGKLLRMDLASVAVSTETALCTHPRGVAFDAKNSAVVATCMDGQMVSLDAVSHRELARQTLPSDLRDVVVDAAGARWITRYRSAELLTWSGETVKRTTRPLAAKSIRLPNTTLLADVLPGPVDAGAGSVPSLNGMPVPVTLSPALAWRTLPSARGGVWMLHQQSQDEEVVVSKGGYGSGCQTITSGAVTEFGADGTPSRSLPVQLQGLSVDAALSPDERWVAIASPGGFARAMSTLQLYATVEAATTSATAPIDGRCPSPSLTVSNENQTVAVAFDKAGVLYALSREPAELQIYELQVLSTTSIGFNGMVRPTPALMRRATIALDLRSMRDTGHDLFHADVGQGLACASCHGEALDDGHVWSFQGIGPRRTQTMRGGLLMTAPFHWDGDMSSMSHLVDDVMTGRMGGFPVELSFATALGQWLQQLPALTLPARDTAAVARGKELFQGSETGCSSCHSGANFTNNESSNVGTGGTFQVPGLLGLALRPPYMHSGCAKTLLERFLPDCGGGDAHGKTSQLSEAQRLDLVAYLNTL